MVAEYGQIISAPGLPLVRMSVGEARAWVLLHGGLFYRD